MNADARLLETTAPYFCDKMNSFGSKKQAYSGLIQNDVGFFSVHKVPRCALEAKNAISGVHTNATASRKWAAAAHVEQLEPAQKLENKFWNFPKIR